MRKINTTGPWIIIAIATLLLIAILILGNLSFRATEKATFDEFNQRQLVLAQEAAGGIELYFETLAGDMRALGWMPEAQYLDEAPGRREIRHTFNRLELLGVNDVGVLDAAGVVRYNVMAPQIEGVDFSGRRYYQKASEMTSDDVYIIEFQGIEAGQKDVLVAVPMFETAADDHHPSPSGQFAGVVICTLKLDTITQRFVAHIQPSERGHVILIDDEYNVLWSPDNSLFGTNILEESKDFASFQQIAESMVTGNSGTGEYSYYAFDESAGAYDRGKKEEKLIAHAPIRLGNESWAIGVWAPQKDAEQLIRSAYLRQLVVVAASILIILFASIFALAQSLRTTQYLEKEVEAKAGELVASHERLLTVLDSLDAVVYVADMETYEILFANKRVQSSWGDVTGKTCWQVLQVGKSGPCDFCTNDKLLDAEGEPGGVYSWEVQNTVTGRWYEVRDRAIRWVDGRIVRLEVAIDASERKLAESALRESEERYRQLVELSPDAIAIQSEDKIVFVNHAGAKLFGAEKPEQLVGKSVWDFVFPEYRESVAQRYRQMQKKGTPAPPVEQRFRRLDGTHVDVQVTAIPSTYQDRPAIQAIFHNIARFKQAEDELRTAHAFQQTILDGMAESIIVIGVDHEIKLMNRVARELWVKDADTSGPLLCHQVSHRRETPCNGVEHPCPLEQVRESGRPVTMVHEHYLASGERRLVKVTATPLWAVDGAFQGIIESTRDITELKWAEEALEHQVQTLARSNEDLEQFAYKIVRSLQDFFEKLPPDEEN